MVHCVGRTWDMGRVPICHVNTCSQAGMTELMGGSVVKKARGGIYFYQCTAPGAVMEGSSTLVCIEHGWNDTLPQCFCKSSKNSFLFASSLDLRRVQFF